MIETPRITKTAEQKVAFIHVVVPRAEIRSAMDAGTAELVALFKAQNIAPTGPWFTHHLQRPIETFDFELCFPIDTPITPNGRVTNGTIAARTVAQTVYHGGYDGLPGAWGELHQWIDANGYVSASDLLETYVINPDSSPDPANWRTRLERPLLT
jgi:effector-binding domain-containing protein